jgi:hypothetical protein
VNVVLKQMVNYVFVREVKMKKNLSMFSCLEELTEYQRIENYATSRRI